MVLFGSPDRWQTCAWVASELSCPDAFHAIVRRCPIRLKAAHIAAAGQRPVFASQAVALGRHQRILLRSAAHAFVADLCEVRDATSSSAHRRQSNTSGAKIGFEPCTSPMCDRSVCST